MKKMIRRIVILLLVFVAAGVCSVFFLKSQNGAEVSYTVMENATLPVIVMDFEGKEINILHGYKSEMDNSFMKETITPIPEDRTIPFAIRHYGNEIKAATFEVRRIEDNTLIEKGTVSDLEKNVDKVNGTIELQDILDKQTEYVLCFTVSTDREESIHYYTRIRYYSDTHLAEEIAYAKHFSDITLTKSDMTELGAQLESNNDADNTSFGYTNIHSSYRHVTWSNLAPSRIGDVTVTLKDMNTMTAGVELRYQVSATHDNVTNTYNVVEYLGLRYVNGKIWLISYERTADQVFHSDELKIKDSQIELGVLSPDNLPVEVRSNGDYTVFAIDGELWSYNKAKNEACRLFSFKQKDDDGVRTMYPQHEFRIINVEENGDTAFTVYGYMNRGTHEGECGLIFYRYNHDENALSEEVFIPSDRPFDVLRKEIGTLSYVGQDQQFYLMFNNSIYAIDFDGQEYVEMINGMGEDSYVVSSDSTAIAWQEEADVYAGKTIHVQYLDDGTLYTIHANEGECIRVLGFIDGDFVYGVAKESDIARGNLIVNFPMYGLVIQDRNQQVVTSYVRDGIYIKAAEISDGIIALTREVRDENGVWNAAPDDALIQNKQESDDKSVVVSSWSDITKTTYTLDFSSNVKENKVLSIKTPKEVAGKKGENLNLVSTANYGKEDSRYYAYSYGKLQGICYTASEAIRLIYDEMGTVTDGNGKELWSRANRKTDAAVMMTTLLGADNQDASLAACLNMMLRQENVVQDVTPDLQEGKSAYDILGQYLDANILDLRGCVLNQVLYYVDQGYPVLAMTEGNKAELILGYDMYKNLIVYSPVLSNTYSITQEAAEQYYAIYGYPFISYIK